MAVTQGWFGRRACIALALVAGAGIAASALVAGAHPGTPAPGLIHACHKKDGSNLRIMTNPNSPCDSNEEVLHWNAVGPQGPAGPAGATGPQGPAGPPGPGATGYWARVGQFGNILASSNVLSVPKQGDDHYNITFNRNILNCAWLVTEHEFSHPNTNIHPYVISDPNNPNTLIAVFQNDGRENARAHFSVVAVCNPL